MVNSLRLAKKSHRVSENFFFICEFTATEFEIGCQIFRGRIAISYFSGKVHLRSFIDDLKRFDLNFQSSGPFESEFVRNAQKVFAGPISEGSLTFCRAQRDITTWIGNVNKRSVDLRDEKRNDETIPTLNLNAATGSG
jgi:hypothetical protein